MSYQQLKSVDRYLKHELPRHCQGDLLRGLKIVEMAPDSKEGELNVDRRSIPYAVVLSQECDLHQDEQNRSNPTRPTQDKYLHSVLIGPAYAAEQVKQGVHLQDQHLVCQQWNSKQWPLIQQNNNDRYHFLPAFGPLQVPDLVLDFKHFLTVPRAALLSQKPDTYFASLGQLFRDSLSQRFANFLARIALPDAADEAHAEPEQARSA
jgi:hypothetical protein